MISTAVHIITITLMMVWNDPLNLPAHLFHQCFCFVRGHSADCGISVSHFFIMRVRAGLSVRAAGAYRWALSLLGRGSGGRK